MATTSSDITSISQARANLSKLADQAKAGAEKILTKNGESYVAIIDTPPPEHLIDYVDRFGLVLGSSDTPPPEHLIDFGH